MELIFQIADEIIKIKIIGERILFANSITHFHYFPIENVLLDKQGILKEHPDLKELPYNEMKRQAINRFKLHIHNLGGEIAIKKYIIDELTKIGYKYKGEK